MLLKIEHHTHYSYSDFVNYTIQHLRLTPSSEFGQYVRRWDIKVKGELHQFQDAYKNISHRLIVNEPHQEIDIVAIGEVETGLDKKMIKIVYLFQYSCEIPSLRKQVQN